MSGLRRTSFSEKVTTFKKYLLLLEEVTASKKCISEKMRWQNWMAANIYIRKMCEYFKYSKECVAGTNSFWK